MKAQHDSLHLKHLGFFKEFPDTVEKDYWYFRLNIPSKLFKNLHIIIEEKISVYAKEVTEHSNGDTCIIQVDYTFENLSKIVNRFNRFHAYDNRRK